MFGYLQFWMLTLKKRKYLFIEKFKKKNVIGWTEKTFEDTPFRFNEM